MMSKRIIERIRMVCALSLVAVLLGANVHQAVRVAHLAQQNKEDIRHNSEDVSLCQVDSSSEDCDLDSAELILQQMTLEDKIYQMFIVHPSSLASGAVVTEVSEIQDSLNPKAVGGLILDQDNIVQREQTMQLTSGIQDAAKTIEGRTLGLFIGVDEEGGSVRRIGNQEQMQTTDIENMADVADVDRAAQVGTIIGRELRELGFNLDFAPVADVATNPDNTVVVSRGRTFSGDAQEVAEKVSACVSGFSESHLLSCLKHFPGHGDTNGDSHYGAAVTFKTLSEMEECELLPFEAGIKAGVPFIMIGHITCPEIVMDDRPATVSREIVTGLLRQKMGYEGIIVTDAMNMEAVNTSESSASVIEAVQAGVDMILMPKHFEEDAQALMNAIKIGKISEEQINESVLRILRTKIAFGIIENAAN